MNTVLISSLAIPGLYKIYKTYNYNIPKAPQYQKEMTIQLPQVKHKWKYFDIDHYEMSRDADKRLFIIWEKRERTKCWWKEQYNIQFSKITG
tara:strand:- start:147 stop:422 length:276 start_codon:yes stop_codon:yes gene_type:complete